MKSGEHGFDPTIFLMLLVFCFSVLGCKGPDSSRKSETSPTLIAKAEVYKRGWRNLQVGDIERDGENWKVHVYRRPLRIIDSYAVVTIGPDGSVIDVFINR